MILSLLLSRWKHVVTTSSSVASLQISRPLDRQNAFVHWEQAALAARFVGGEVVRFSRVRPSIGTASRAANKEESVDLRREVCSSLVPVAASSSATMVLFLKQVHLQKEGAAGTY